MYPLLCICSSQPHLLNFRLTLLWYHAVIRPFVALDEGSNEEGLCVLSLLMYMYNVLTIII